MPRSKDNPRNQLGALFGDRVLVERQGKKFIITTLKPRRRKKSSEAQKARQELFKEAVTYAKRILKDSKRKAAYKRNLKGRRNPYQAAVAEYMKSNSRR